MSWSANFNKTPAKTPSLQSAELCKKVWKCSVNYIPLFLVFKPLYSIEGSCVLLPTCFIQNFKICSTLSLFGTAFTQLHTIQGEPSVHSESRKPSVSFSSISVHDFTWNNVLRIPPSHQQGSACLWPQCSWGSQESQTADSSSHSEALTQQQQK